MAKISAYFKETYDELAHKVTWPTWSELQTSAIVVMVASVIIAIVVLAMDLIFRNGLEFLYGLFY
ncbi:MAG: preprotein translocase subunit SecE [Bacteroidales bacterium]|nr:preprotein translocase subunit SecE [Bacteroidales bacterium]HOY38177.1 preprotein translocase subunit SecE [Bacteroidales bacterium]HQP04074.1 preprotein translocase subunit SecE [Bacteroidales bacterium]